MTRQTDVFTFGIEEEYSLVNTVTRELAQETPPQLLADLKSALGDRFSTEYMRSQVEIGTDVCSEFTSAGEQLLDYRRTIGKLAAPYGLAPMAASTHPFSRWSRQKHRPTERYGSIAESFQGLAKRMVINGLHVHVGIDDPDMRIAIMNAVRPYLPLLLALSGSSPFWQGENTGLKSFRSAINDATPRSGIPEHYANWAGFQRHMAVLIRAGLMEDASKVWWDLRPSIRFPTLESRITDICPRIEDGLCVAALFRCLCRRLHRTVRPNSKSEPLPLVLINENRWRAERYGTSQGQLDITAGTVEPFPLIIEGLLEFIAEDAAYFGCQSIVEHARSIASRGTSADRQVARYNRLRRGDHSHREALKGVVDLLLEETVSNPARRLRPASSAQSGLSTQAGAAAA